jgi:hypothetical protein
VIIILAITAGILVAFGIVWEWLMYSFLSVW